jgi:Xaa-Pro aminopeptidase
LAALVVARSANVYYLSNYWAISARQGSLDSSFAVLPRDPSLPIALVMSEFSYYYTAADDALPAGVALYLYSAPNATADPARVSGYEPQSFFAAAPSSELNAREQQRRERTRAVGRSFGSRKAALASALKDLGIPTTADSASKVGVDDLAAQQLLAQVRQGFTSNADDTLRRIRLVKTPAEIALMRLASQANVEAALATAHVARELRTVHAVRTQFFAEAAARGNAPVFMVVDGVSSDAYDAPLVPGSAFMMDCVTQLRGYHGDFARTVCVGEPSAAMQRITGAMTVGWDEVRARLKPGLKFSEIARLGRDTIAKQGFRYAIPFAPHSVGLFHSDQPRLALDGTPIDVVLEEGMIVSVDCPLMEVGYGGSAHFEDLTLITRTGSEAIHATGQALIIT